jgi:acyl-CoA synthetase (AMP-forming)/AMP-acid ligase II
LATTAKERPVFVPCAPLMHGTGAIAAFGALSSGGTVVTLAGRSFQAEELLDTIEREGVKGMAIVGEAFAQPILAALDAEPDRWDLSSLRMITSSGVMWSDANKAGLLRHNPRLILVDSLGSSEAVGMATSVQTASGPSAAGAAPATGDGPTFVASGTTQVLTEDGRPVEPGSDEVGMVAHRGRVPVGYYKDETKSAATFRVIDGVRWSIPGDHARVGADGELILLGRGSQCINTGGEKVYPEEPEEALRSHPDVIDVACVGVPDPRWGQRIVALVQLAPGVELDQGALIDHVKGRLAAYKAPKRIHAIDSTRRGANGKLDYRRLQEEARRLEGV